MESDSRRTVGQLQTQASVGVGAVRPAPRQPDTSESHAPSEQRGYLLERLWNPDTEAWAAVVKKPFAGGIAINCGVSESGRREFLRLNQTPIEHVVAHESATACGRAYRNDPRLVKCGFDWEHAPEKMARLHLALEDEHRPLEGLYWTLRSADVFLEHLLGAVDDVEAHIWRWMLLGKVSEERFEKDALALMETRLAKGWLGFRYGAAAITMVGRVLEDDVAVKKLKKTHKAIWAEMHATHEALDALMALLQTMPTGMRGFAKWIKALNGISAVVWRGMMPTPFGMKRTIKRAVKRCRKLMKWSAATQGTGSAGSGEVSGLVSGDTISAISTDKTLEFRITATDVERAAAGGNKARSPDIRLYSAKDGTYVASLGLYIVDTARIDHVTTLKLMVESGHEEGLITRGDWYDIADPVRFEQLVAHRYKPLHAVDSRSHPETRRLYGEPANMLNLSRHDLQDADDWLHKDADERVVDGVRSGHYEYDVARFGRFRQRARGLAMAWLWTAVKDNPGVLEVAQRAEALIWQGKSNGRRGGDAFAQQVLGLLRQEEI